MSKKTTIIVFNILFVLIFIVAGFFIIRNVYYQLLGSLIDQYAQEKLTLAKQVASTIEDEIKSTEVKLKLMAAIPEVQDSEEDTCNQKLKELSHLNPRISNIGRIGPDKTFVCSLNESLIGTDAQRLGSYVNQIFEDPEHKTVISRIINVPNSGYAVAIHVPVYNDDGEFVGTLGGAIYFKDFSENFLQDVEVSQQGYVVLQDDDGTIFYHPQTDLIGQNRRPKTEEEMRNASAITPLIIESAETGSTGTSRYVSTLDNKEKVGAYAPANILERRRWIVIVTVPIEEIQTFPLIREAQSAFWKMFLLVIASILILPLVLVVYLIVSVFRPLQKIGTAATEIGKGNLSITIPVKSQDEIGILARIFNEMTQRLRQSYESLEAKVHEKTATLSDKLSELEENKKAMLNILEDLNDRKEQLEEKESQLAEAQEAGNVGTFTWNLKENVIDISSQVYRMYGVNPDTKKQPIENFLSLVHPQDKEAVSEKMKVIAGQKDPFEITYRCVWSDGTIRWLRARGQNVFDKNGEAVEVIGTIHDITKEKELEKLKDEFVSVASHELRTPMGAIKSFVSMILQGDYGKVNKNLEEPLRDIKSSTDRLVNLVNDLLNVARIEAGRMKFTVVHEDIRKTLETVVKNLSPLAKDKGIALTLSESPSVNVQFDSDKITQVVTNLVGNSLKFTDKGSITLSLVEKEDMVAVHVADTGTGIAKEDQEKLFGKFQQANVTGARPAGTGLGLYISRQIVRKLGGDLWISESELGKGSTFTFSLPKADGKKAKEVLKNIETEAETHPDQK